MSGGDAASAFAPAKINLALHVTGRRADGYHLLESLVVFADVGDTVTIRRAAADAFAIDGPFSEVLANEAPGSNLVLRARDAWRGAGGDAGKVAIRLTKRLPLASGIGGGSADAAATLEALDRMAAKPLGMDCLRRLASPLGADVPMCLCGVPLLARGIGEEVETLPAFPQLDIVLVTPPVPVSTPEVFRMLTHKENPPLPPVPAGGVAEIAVWLDRTRNDLEEPASRLRPEIGVALQALGQAGAAFARMSGSGATCFGLFPSTHAAVEAARVLRSRHADWFVAATQTTSSLRGE